MHMCRQKPPEGHHEEPDGWLAICHWSTVPASLGSKGAWGQWMPAWPVVEAAMKLKKVKADAIIHDDACHFEAHVHRHQGIKKRFRTIKHFIVDEFHRCNHKCKKCKLTPSEKRRFKGVRTNMSEVFNSWVRRKNFMYNSMRPSSHKFWVHEAILFWNKHLREMPTYSVRRSTAVTRKRPAARQ